MYIFTDYFTNVSIESNQTASSVWSPMFKKDKILIKMYNVVKCLKHVSFEDRLKTLGLPSFEYRRERSDMIQVYKIMHGIDKVD